jgi:hypothetical protein
MLNDLLAFQSKTIIFTVFSIAPFVLLFVFYWIFKMALRGKTLPDDDQSFLTNTLTGLITLACISIGFSYSIAIQNQSQADSDLVNEAVHIESLERFLTIDGSPEGLKARQYLREYAASIVKDEWPQFLNGNTSPVTTELADKFERHIENIQPLTPKQTSIYSAIIANVEKVKSARLQRILNSTTSIPAIFTRLNNLLILLIIIVSAFLMVQTSHIKKFALTLQCFIFSLFLGGIVVLDYPYIGPSPVSPDSIISVMKVT